MRRLEGLQACLAGIHTGGIARFGPGGFNRRVLRGSGERSEGMQQHITCASNEQPGPPKSQADGQCSAVCVSGIPTALPVESAHHGRRAGNRQAGRRRAAVGRSIRQRLVPLQRQEKTFETQFHPKGKFRLTFGDTGD